MRALIQRVTRASVASRDESGEWEVVGEVGPGLCAFVGATHDDDTAGADRMAAKIWGLRILDDEDGVMNRSVGDTGGDVLVVSQFTLYGDTAKGRRPSWTGAAPPEVAEPLVDRVAAQLTQLAEGTGSTIATGRFRTEMSVELVNDGPVTLMLEI